MREFSLGVYLWFKAAPVIVTAAPVRIISTIAALAVSLSALLGVGLAATAVIQNFSSAIESSGESSALSSRFFVRCREPLGCDRLIRDRERALSALGQLGSVSVYFERMVAIPKIAHEADNKALQGTEVLELPLIVTDLGSLGLDSTDVLVTSSRLFQSLPADILSSPVMFLDEQTIHFSAVHQLNDNGFDRVFSVQEGVLYADFGHSQLAEYARTLDTGALILTPFEGSDTNTTIEQAASLGFNLHPNSSVLHASQPPRRSEMLAAFSMNITVMVILMLLVAIALLFVAYQRMSEERAHDSAVLQTLGARAPLLLGYLLAEAVVCGILGALIAVTLGSAIIKLVAEALLDSASTLFLGGQRGILPDFSEPWVIIAAVIFAVGCSLLGACVPVWRLVQGVRRNQQHVEHEIKSHDLIRSCVLLVVISAVIGGAVWWGMMQRSVPFALGGTFLSVCWIALMGSLLLRVAAYWYRLFTESHRSSQVVIITALVQSAVMTLSRAVAVGAVAIALVLSLTGMVNSFRERLEAWAAETVTADVVVRALAPGGLAEPPFLSSALVDQLRKLPDVSCVETRSLSFGVEVQQQGPIHAVVLSDACVKRSLLIGELPRSLGDILVNEASHRLLNLSPGGELSIEGHLFRVSGVIQDFTPEGALLYLSEEQRRLFQPDRESEARYASVNVYSGPSAQISAVQESVFSATRGRGLAVTGSTLRNLMLSTFDQTFFITRFMRWCVSALGIVALVVLFGQWINASAHIRGALQLLGVTQKEEYLGLGSIAVVTLLIVVSVGVIGGYLCAWLLSAVVNPISFGWSFPLQYDWYSSLFYTLISVGGALAVAALGRGATRPHDRES